MRLIGTSKICICCGRTLDLIEFPILERSKREYRCAGCFKYNPARHVCNHRGEERACKLGFCRTRNPRWVRNIDKRSANCYDCRLADIDKGKPINPYRTSLNFIPLIIGGFMDKDFELAKTMTVEEWDRYVESDTTTARKRAIREQNQG